VAERKAFPSESEDVVLRSLLPVSSSRHSVIAIFLPALLICAAAALAAPSDPAEHEHTTIRALGKALGLKFTDLSDAGLRACKLSGDNDEIMFVDGLTTILIGNTRAQLASPIKWNGSNFILSREGAELVAARLDKPLDLEYRKPNPGRSDKLAPKRTKHLRKRLFTVVIDPGHGGKDSGAVRGKLKEKTVNLDIARRLKRRLETRRIKVVMTRDKDVWLDLDTRVAIANKAKPDLFISIHANAEPVTWGRAQGAMTLYPPKGRRGAKPPIDQRARNEVLTRSISPSRFGAGGSVNPAAMIPIAKVAFESYRWLSIALAKEIQSNLAPVAGTCARNNGVNEDPRGLRVLSRIHAPAVLVEVDFLSNPERNRKLATASYRAELAGAIGNAVVTFLNRSSTKRPAP